MTRARFIRIFIMSLAALCCVGLPIAAGGGVVSSTWICESDDWTETSCWDTLDGADLYPDNAGAVTYEVTLPAGSYTVTVDPAADSDITIDMLDVPESGPKLSVKAGKTLNVLLDFSSHADLISRGAITADAGAVVDIDESELDALEGGSIDLPATSYIGSESCSSETIEANGVGSAVVLSDLTSVDAMTCGSLTFLASAGGFVDLSGLTSSVNGVAYKADGVGSVLLFDQMSALSNGNVTVLDGGTILAAPFTSLDGVTLTVGDSTSVLDLSQVTSIDEAIVTAQAGALITFPLVASYVGSAGCSSETLKATGSDSVLDLTAITSLDGMTCGTMTILASSGGYVDLSNLPASLNGVTYRAEGASSELHIDLMDTLFDGSVTVLDGGSIIAAPFMVLEGIGITVDHPDSFLDLTQVTSIDESTVTVQDGATVSFPLVTSYTGSSSCSSETLKAIGIDSVLELTTITSLDGMTCGNVTVVASSGGYIDLSNLPASQNEVTYRAEGANSELRIDLLDTLPDGSVTVLDGGTIVAAPFTVLEGIAITVDHPDSSLDLTQVISIDESTVTVQDGATVSFPLVTSYTGTSSCSSETLKATGVGSVLDLSTFTSVDGLTCGNVTILATSGGFVDLSNLPASQNNVTYKAEGAASELRIDLLSTVPDGSVTVLSGGAIVAAPFTELDNIVLTVGDPTSTIDLSQVTTIDASNVTAQDGATIALPLVTSYLSPDGCGSETLKATGGGSMLDLSFVTAMDGGTCANLNIQALSGGVVDLSALPTGSGNLALKVSGADGALYVGGIHLDAGGSIDVSEGIIEVEGAMSYEATSFTNFEWTDGATLSMLGTNLGECEGLEVAGSDFGDDPEGYIENFQLERLLIGSGAQIDLVDHFDNGSVGGVGGCREALYVDTLEFQDARGRLLTNGLHVYYNTLIGNRSQIIADLNCVFDPEETCDGDANGDGTVDPLDSGFVLARFGCLVGTCIKECDAADQNNDGAVDPLDSGFVLARFGPCP